MNIRIIVAVMAATLLCQVAVEASSSSSTTMSLAMPAWMELFWFFPDDTLCHDCRRHDSSATAPTATATAVHRHELYQAPIESSSSGSLVLVYIWLAVALCAIVRMRLTALSSSTQQNDNGQQDENVLQGTSRQQQQTQRNHPTASRDCGDGPFCRILTKTLATK